MFLLLILIIGEAGGGSRQAGVSKVGTTGMCESVAMKEAIKVSKNPDDTSKEVVPGDELYESSSESDQETENMKESESGLGFLNLGGVESECDPGNLNLGDADAWRSHLQLDPITLGLGAVPRGFVHSSASSTTSTLPVSPPSGLYMNPAPSSTDASRAGSYNLEGFEKREERLFPSSSPVLTSAISSTLFASSISSLRLMSFLF